MPRTITLTWIDWIIMAIVLLSILRGARFGVLAGLVDLAVLGAAFLAAAAFYPAGAALALHYVTALSAPWAAFAAFLVIWLGLYLAAGLLVRLALGGAAPPASRMLGGVLGGIRGLVLVTALLVVTLASPFHGAVAPDAKRSQVVPYLLRANDRVEVLLLPRLPVHVERIGPGGRLF